jgi:NAD(P)-dependent dehydrogenase (short-subunit alcohol dehydrogenase family)
MLSGLAEQVTALASSIKLRTPRIPYLSNVTGTWITDEEATDPAYWAKHMCQTVRFADGVGQLLEKTDCFLLEVGPGQALSFFAKQHPASAGARREQILPTLPAPHGQQKQDPHAFLLTTLGKLWLAGVPMDWHGYYTHEKRQRVILPTYPFERQRYWISGGDSSLARAFASASQEQKQVLAPAEILAGLKKEELADWFYLPGWKHAAPQLPAPLSEEGETTLRWLLFLDELGVAEQLRTHLLERGHDVVTVQAGTAFARHSATSFSVRPAERTDYSLLLLALQELQQVPQRVVHCWGVTPSLVDLAPEVRLARVLETSFYSLMALAQAMGEIDLEEACHIVAVSNNLHDVTGTETICPEKAVVIGPARVIAQEYPTLSCRSVDIAIPANAQQQRTLIVHLLGEVLTPTKEPIVALRRTGRWLLTFDPVHIPAQPLEETPLRQGGTYLITGGLGGIGLAMANYLARTLQANLVLTSRSGLPAREQWEQISAEQGSEKGVGRQISQVLALEALGSSVLPLAADTANAEQMEAAVQLTCQTYGTLHGVIHAAGLPAVGLMQNKTAAQAASVMAPKLEGTLALEYALRNCELDFLVFFSSITSATGGGPGQIDYCAGNAYMDACALQQVNASRRTVAINWGEWQWNAWDSGLSGYDEETQAFFRANRQAFGISFEEGAEALQRILAQPFPEVIVSTQDFSVISQLSRTHTAATALEQFHQARGNRQRHERPPMRNEYAAPQSDLERTIVGVWEDILGIDGIGVRDNFFDLGGNSLVGIELITQVRKALHMQTLPSYVLYEAPTVESMAAFLSREETPAQEEQENRQERSDKRRENLKLRMRERVVR